MKNKRYEKLIKCSTIYNAILDQKYNILCKSGLRFKLKVTSLNGTIDDSHNSFISMIDSILLDHRLGSSEGINHE